MDLAAADLARTLSTRWGGRWRVRAAGGSGLCNTWHAVGAGPPCFVKTAPLERASVLEAEADGLDALAATHTIRVPRLFGCWHDLRQGVAVLALEWLDLHAPDAGFGARFGHALAALHAQPPREGGGRYGWRRDNMIGGTPQSNAWSRHGGLEGWIEFWGTQRLGAMRARLAARGSDPALLDAVGRVIEQLPSCFDDGHEPCASLIHGDLWSGNWGMLADGTPVVYDPAVSCSDAEAELAMMDLFGSPPAQFWPAYRQGMPLRPGYAQRRGLYQLYRQPAICVYDVSKLTGEMMIDLLRTHPLTLVGGIVQENPFYTPPTEMLQELRQREAGGRAAG